MGTHVLLVALIIGCLQFSSAEAGILDWFTKKKPPNSAGNVGNKGYGSGFVFAPVITSSGGSMGNGMIISGTLQQMNWGPVYQALILRTGDGANCNENVTISLTEEKLSKIFIQQCPKDKALKRIKNEEGFLLVGDPSETFCAFSVGKKELFYLKDGKWKKGEFGSDNNEDEDLTSSEIDSVKERIKKWQAFFEESAQEIEKIRSLKNSVREKYYDERDKIYDERGIERKNYQKNLAKIRQLRNQERNRYLQEVKNIRDKIKRKKMTYEEAQPLFQAELDKNQKNLNNIYQLEQDESKRYDIAINNITGKINEASNNMNEELKKLEDLVNKEQERRMNEIKIKISQGW